MTPHYVYRAFDQYDLLLYVGCSKDVPRRLTQHKANGTWYPYMARVESEGPYSQDQALNLEAKAIRTEGPYFNAQPEHTRMIQANRNASLDLLHGLGIPRPTDDTPEDVSNEWWEAWNVARNAIGVLIAAKYPTVTDDTRKLWYLAARNRIARSAA